MAALQSALGNGGRRSILQIDAGMLNRWKFHAKRQRRIRSPARKDS